MLIKDPNFGIFLDTMVKSLKLTKLTGLESTQFFIMTTSQIFKMTSQLIKKLGISAYMTLLPGPLSFLTLTHSNGLWMTQTLKTCSLMIA